MFLQNLLAQYEKIKLEKKDLSFEQFLMETNELINNNKEEANKAFTFNGYTKDEFIGYLKEVVEEYNNDNNGELEYEELLTFEQEEKEVINQQAQTVASDIMKQATINRLVLENYVEKGVDLNKVDRTCKAFIVNFSSDPKEVLKATELLFKKNDEIDPDTRMTYGDLKARMVQEKLEKLEKYIDEYNFDKTDEQIVHSMKDHYLDYELMAQLVPGKLKSSIMKGFGIELSDDFVSKWDNFALKGQKIAENKEEFGSILNPLYPVLDDKKAYELKDVFIDHEASTTEDTKKFHDKNVCTPFLEQLGANAESLKKRLPGKNEQDYKRTLEPDVISQIKYTYHYDKKKDEFIAYDKNNNLLTEKEAAKHLLDKEEVRLMDNEGHFLTKIKLDASNIVQTPKKLEMKNVNKVEQEAKSWNQTFKERANEVIQYNCRLANKKLEENNPFYIKWFKSKDADYNKLINGFKEIENMDLNDREKVAQKFNALKEITQHYMDTHCTDNKKSKVGNARQKIVEQIHESLNQYGKNVLEFKEKEEAINLENLNKNVGPDKKQVEFTNEDMKSFQKEQIIEIDTSKKIEINTTEKKLNDYNK